MSNKKPRFRFFLRQRHLAVPSLFFLGILYYEELFLKLYIFHALTFAGTVLTLLFTLPIALLLGLLCGSVRPKQGRVLLVVCTTVLSLWIGAQSIYYRLFKTFLTIFSLTKMGMVAGAFGNVAQTEILMNWFPVVMMAIPPVLSFFFRRRLIPDQPEERRVRLSWLALAAAAQVAAMVIVWCCHGGVLSLRYIYYNTATPELEAQYFGILTQTQLEARRVIFGILPDLVGTEPVSDGSEASSSDVSALEPVETHLQPSQTDDTADTGYHTLPIDFQKIAGDTEDEDLQRLNQWLSQREPTAENLWTGYFAGKNLIWIVAESFSTLAMDPERTPVLWQLSHEGFVFSNFYTPLWGVSTSDGEYVTTTGLIPKSGVWSYSQSSENYMPFALGTQFKNLGYRTMAFHDYLYTYYDRNLSHPNMGYEYIAMGQGLDPEDIIPEQFLDAENQFPPSDQMMMEKIVPKFVNEDHFMVYCLTVSGHLQYNVEENAMSALHWDEVADLPYSDGVKAYLASQIELELAMESLLDQLEAAGKLEDTVIVLSADHYPYGLSDEEYSELLGHEVDPVFEIYQNTLILWNSEMEGTVHVNKYCSSLDITPTLSNLFGLPYDSRLMMGTDILSDQEALVIFSNYSFINQDGYYNSSTDQFTRWDGGEPDLEAVSGAVAEVQSRVAYSAAILDYDYYRIALNGPEKEVPEKGFTLPDPPWKREDRPENTTDP